MKLKVLGSSSQGNCYILENKDEALILEAGVNMLEVKKALGWNIRKVAGCLITHQHNDHSKYIKNMVDSGFYTLALEDVWKAKGISIGKRAVELHTGKGYKLGNFKIIAFSACHDVPCVGYVVNHPDFGRLVFITDSFMCEYTFPNLNHIMLECNYSDAKLIESIRKGYTQPSQRERLMTSHMELSTCKETLKANDLRKVEEIILIHLSRHNSDEEMFVSDIEKSTGKAVYAAKPGMELELNNYMQ